MIQRMTFVVTSSALGGGELCLLHFADALSHLMPVRIASHRASPLTEECRRLGLLHAHIDLGRKLSKRSAASNLARFISARNALDSFMSDADRSELLGFQYKWEQLLWGGRHSTERVLMFEHGPIPAGVARFPVVRHQLRRAYTNAASVFAWSEPARRSIQQLADRASMILLAGVDTRACAEALLDRDNARQELGVQGTRVLGFVGRVTRDKGIFACVSALTHLPRVKLLVCGDGPDLSSAKAHAARLGVNGQIHWLGWRSDALRYIAAVDTLLLLSTSHGEGRPLAVLEALAVGTPVIALAKTSALKALGSYPGVSLVDDLTSPTVAHAALAAFSLRRSPKPIHDWSETAAQFCEGLRTQGVLA